MTSSGPSDSYKALLLPTSQLPSIWSSRRDPNFYSFKFLGRLTFACDYLQFNLAEIRWVLRLGFIKCFLEKPPHLFLIRSVHRLITGIRGLKHS